MDWMLRRNSLEKVKKKKKELSTKKKRKAAWNHMDTFECIKEKELIQFSS
jgi:hypothetical protein